MIVPDVNLLLYAYNREAPLHNEARNWWVGLINGTEWVGIPWAVANSFLRLLTIRGLLTHPATPSQALDFVREWFRQPHVAPLNPGSQHLTLLGQLLAAAGVGGNLVMDAHLAALAMEYQAEVHSNDTDFGRFPGLRWRNPL